MNELEKILPKSGNLTRSGWELPSNLTKKEWFEIGNSFSQLNGAVQWAWGDWWNSGAWEHGERKQMVDHDSWNGLAYETLKRYGEVCRQFEIGIRIPLLTFAHHQHCLSLPIDEAIKVLEWAVENGASTRATATKVKEVKAWLAQGWNSSQLERKQMVENGVTVVASKRDDMDSALIAWADQQGLMVEIGRGTKWGNPFELDKDGDRETVCKAYEHNYLPCKHSLTKVLENELKGKVLVCWCHPESCHGDILAKYSNNGFDEEAIWHRAFTHPIDWVKGLEDGSHDMNYLENLYTDEYSFGKFLYYNPDDEKA